MAAVFQSWALFAATFGFALQAVWNFSEKWQKTDIAPTISIGLLFASISLTTTANGITAIALVWQPLQDDINILPWTFLVGGMIQLVSACVSNSRGLTFESCSQFLMSVYWLSWSFQTMLGFTNSSIIENSCDISFMTIFLLMVVLSTINSKTWFCLWISFFCLSLRGVLTMPNTNIATYVRIMAVILAVISLYCFLSSCTGWVPTGSPLFDVSYIYSQYHAIKWAESSKVTGIERIADVLNSGGIAGIPSDTVYVAVAACKSPTAVQRLYKTKKQASQRPMSLWISNVDQISAGRGVDFSDILWEFMKAVWPSSISLVVSRGQWVDALGMGDASQYVGKPDSIAVRMPNTTILSHLIELTGPIVVTSANPSGEADTTHHIQVLAKRGVSKCDVILRDGPSAENIASTVVDCRKIDSNKLAFFRVGLVPKSDIYKKFENIHEDLKCHPKSSLASNKRLYGCNTADKRIGFINEGFENDMACVLRNSDVDIEKNANSNTKTCS